MFINKIGTYHINAGINCQDFGFNMDKYKLVCDGCSEAIHSEVGAKTFSFMLSSFIQKNNERLTNDNSNFFNKSISEIFNNMISWYPISLNIMPLINLYSFTIIHYEEYETFFNVCNCGDGYIITQDSNGKLEFLKIDEGTSPKYFIYNYINSDLLNDYKNGVQFDIHRFEKNEYDRVGIASDGIRFILENEDLSLIEEFKDILIKDKEVCMKRFINRNQKIFKDDVTISW